MTDRKSSRSSFNANNKQYESLPFIDDKLSEINDSMANASARPREKKGANAQDLQAAYEKHQ